MSGRVAGAGLQPAQELGNPEPIPASMSKTTVISFASVFLTFSAALAQMGAPIPSAPVTTEAAVDPLAIPVAPTMEEPAPIPPPLEDLSPTDPLGSVPLEEPAANLPPTQVVSAANSGTLDPVSAAPSRPMNDFQGDDVATVLRLLARQAKINLVVSDLVTQSQMTVTMRLEDKSPMEVINIIARSKGLSLDELDGVYYVKTAAEKQGEPTDPAFYIFSYANAEAVKDLLVNQLGGGEAQGDPRTNAIFYRVKQSQIDSIALFLETIDRPTKQVMIEARLVEVTANPRQQYGIDWSGALAAKTVSFGGSTVAQNTSSVITNTANSVLGVPGVTGTTAGTATTTTLNGLGSGNFLLDGGTSNFLSALAGQFAILTAPQLTLTLSAINSDSTAEFLANPRVVTADNQEANIKIIRSQPVPQFNFNEQTATTVYSGTEEKQFGNTLKVKPTINKDGFITLAVEPEISNKVGDLRIPVPGATDPILAPIIDTRSLVSNVLIKSGDTLAIGGLLQDEVGKTHTKVPVLGDIPLLGYMFQSKDNIRNKRNLLVFVTPTIIGSGYGTGLEDQVDGLHHSGEEFADPNGWRNNARGAIRLAPTANRQVVADYPAPGTPLAPERVTVDYRASAFSRER